MKSPVGWAAPVEPLASKWFQTTRQPVLIATTRQQVAQLTSMLAQPSKTVVQPSSMLAQLSSMLAQPSSDNPNDEL